MIERAEILGPVYWTDRNGVRWRVYDVRYREGRIQRWDAPSSRGTHRAFVAASGVKRLYVFTRGEKRQLTETILQAQLERSEYLPNSGPAMPVTDPR